MATQILRPSKKDTWRVQGAWGKREYKPMSKIQFYDTLHRELLASGILPPNSPAPSNRYHGHVTMAILSSSWIGCRWVLDEPRTDA